MALTINSKNDLSRHISLMDRFLDDHQMRSLQHYEDKEGKFFGYLIRGPVKGIFYDLFVLNVRGELFDISINVFGAAKDVRVDFGKSVIHEVDITKRDLINQLVTNLKTYSDSFIECIVDKSKLTNFTEG